MAVIFYILMGAKLAVDWIGRTTVSDDLNQLIERMPAILAWLYQTPWWVPGALAATLTVFLIYAARPSEVPVWGLGPSKRDRQRSAGLRAVSIAHQIDRALRFRLDPPGPLMAEAMAVMIQFDKFGLKVPHFQDDLGTDEGMMLVRNYLGMIGPILRDGQIREAKQIAAKMAAELSGGEAQ